MVYGDCSLWGCKSRTRLSNWITNHQKEIKCEQIFLLFFLPFHMLETTDPDKPIPFMSISQIPSGPTCLFGRCLVNKHLDILHLVRVLWTQHSFYVIPCFPEICILMQFCFNKFGVKLRKQESNLLMHSKWIFSQSLLRLSLTGGPGMQPEPTWGLSQKQTKNRWSSSQGWSQGQLSVQLGREENTGGKCWTDKVSDW